jgi:Peptidase M50B-like
VAAAVVGVVAFGLVLTEIGWRIIRHGTVMAHEGAHAVALTLLFLRIDYIELYPDATGGTTPKSEGGCLVEVIAFFVGYIGPASFGLGAAKLIQLGYAVTVLWVTLFLLGLLLLLLRWSFGRVTVILAAGLVFAVLRYTPVLAQIVAAYAIAWLLLLSGVRGIMVRRGGSGDSQNLRRLTLIPHVIWFLIWLAAALGAVAVGGSWLIMRA